MGGYCEKSAENITQTEDKTDLIQSENKTSKISIDNEIKRIEINVDIQNNNGNNKIISGSLKFTTITSPVDGRISIMDYRAGEVVDPSMETPIATIAANKHIYAYTSISEEMFSNFLEEYGCRSAYELINKLPAVTLSTTWGEKMEQQGRIDAINSSTDASTGAILVRASFNNPSELFRNGSNGYIDIPTAKHGVYVIPQDAAIHIQDKYFVYRVVDGKAVSTEVKVLPPTDDQQYVVTSGLNEDDIIIAEHAGMVSEGMAVGQETKK